MRSLSLALAERHCQSASATIARLASSILSMRRKSPYLELRRVRDVLVLDQSRGRIVGVGGIVVSIGRAGSGSSSGPGCIGAGESGMGVVAMTMGSGLCARGVLGCRRVSIAKS